MSIKDYNERIVILNEVTNDRIIVPKIDYDEIVTCDLRLNELILLRELTRELVASKKVTIKYEYVKD